MRFTKEEWQAKNGRYVYARAGDELVFGRAPIAEVYWSPTTAQGEYGLVREGWYWKTYGGYELFDNGPFRSMAEAVDSSRQANKPK